MTDNLGADVPFLMMIGKAERDAFYDRPVPTVPTPTVRIPGSGVYGGNIRYDHLAPGHRLPNQQKLGAYVAAKVAQRLGQDPLISDGLRTRHVAPRPPSQGQYRPSITLKPLYIHKVTEHESEGSTPTQSPDE